MISWLSKGLKTELQQAHIEPYLRIHPSINEVMEEDGWLSRAICVKACHTEFSAHDEVIFVTGSQAVGMYVLKRGNFVYTTVSDQVSFLRVGEPRRSNPLYLSELALIQIYMEKLWFHKGMLRCTDVGEFMTVHRDAFCTCLKDFPELEDLYGFVCSKRMELLKKFYEDPEEEGGETVGRLRTALNDYVDPELCGITNNTVVHKDELKKT